MNLLLQKRDRKNSGKMQGTLQFSPATPSRITPDGDKSNNQQLDNLMPRVFIPLLRTAAFVALVTLSLSSAIPTSVAAAGETPDRFAIISDFSVAGNAEIIKATAGGLYLIHTNSDRSSIDVVDITDPGNARTIASVDMPGEPTSVDVSPDGKWALAVVYASKSKPNEEPLDPRIPGVLALIDLRNPAKAAVTGLVGIGHHPDSIAVTQSGDELVGIIAIENEPLIVVEGKVVEDDAPGNANDISEKGVIQIVAINPEQPTQYSVKTLLLDASLLRTAQMLNTDDPQPEYVALSPDKKRAAVSLQENNGIVVIDTMTREIVAAFNLGTVSERPADLRDDGEVKLVQSYPANASGGQAFAGKRFPDAVSFTPDGKYILSADEGELPLTGGRGFSIWTPGGDFVWDDGGEIERRASELGLYKDKRSDERGIEVEGITAARFGSRDYAFALSERGSFVVIYDITDARAPSFVQILPTGKAPESVVAIPERNLLVVAAEKKGTITIIGYNAGTE
jgi:DNA-binding beta-propeller fold protein YncE